MWRRPLRAGTEAAVGCEGPGGSIIEEEVAADVVPDGEQASRSGRTVLLSRQRRGAGGVLQKQLGAQEGSGGLN
jgi:hypothetical protein